MTDQEFYKRFEQVTHLLRLEQQEIAEDLNVCPDTVRRWLCWQSAPYAAVRSLVMEYLGQKMNAYLKIEE